MTVIQAILLGLVQGITEFLPISSSGHLSIFQNLFGIETGQDSNLLFDVLLHLGTLVSVCAAYRRDLVKIYTDFRNFFRLSQHPVPGMENKRFPGARMVLMIAVATFPLVLILPIHNQIEQLYNSTLFIGIALILTGAMLFASDRMPRGNKREKNMTVVDALMIGLSQAVATVPGLSRSGTTITAGMATGLGRQFAVKFSFLISIPAVLGANVISLGKAFADGIQWSLVPLYLLGMLVAMFTGYAAIILLRFIVKKGKFGYFAYYCAFAGVLTLILTFAL